MNPHAPALATADDVTALADALSAGADTLRKRLERELARGALTHEQAQRLNDDAALLREQAGALYADAAALVLAGLPLAQERLLAAVAQANARIGRLEKIATLLALAGDLAALAGAAVGGKAGAVLAAVKKLKADGATYAKLG